MPKTPKLTEKEARIMSLLWEHGPMFVREMLTHYDEPRPHFNTVSVRVQLHADDLSIGAGCMGLELGTGGYECLAGCVVLVLLEVVDEAFCEVLGLDGPFFCVGIGVAGVEDFGINAGKLGGNLEVEDGAARGRFACLYRTHTKKIMKKNCTTKILVIPLPHQLKH